MSLNFMIHESSRLYPHSYPIHFSNERMTMLNCCHNQEIHIFDIILKRIISCDVEFAQAQEILK